MRSILAVLLTWGALGPVAAATTQAGPFDLEIAAGKFDERCLPIAAGQSIRFEYRATAPVDFNIHYHRGREIFYPIKRAGVRRDAGSFRAEAGDDYCLMWENRGQQPARIDGRIDLVP